MDLLCDITIKEKNAALLYEKYPEIAFQYSCTSFEKKYSEEVEDDSLVWRQSLPLDHIDTLYIYGLASVAYYRVMKDWLREKKERALIFLENELEEIDTFLEKEEAEELLLDPQVSLFYVATPSAWEVVLEECTIAFPSDRIELSASAKYRKKHPKKVASIRLRLLRKAALVHSLLSEALHYHVLTNNLSSSFSHLSNSSYVNELKGAFKNVPAIICGAGPSLNSVTEELKDLTSNALIFGGGSAITALANLGVRAHINVALDPNDEEYVRLKPSQAFGVPFFYASRINQGVFDALSSPLGYMSTDTGGTLESWVEEKLSLNAPYIGADLSSEALSVTTIAVSLAHLMGCNPILFCGVDLAYTGMKRYSDGVMTSSSVKSDALKRESKAMEKMVLRKDRHGKKIYTLVKWIMEASCLAQFATTHPETEFFKCTDAGLEIPGVPYKNFSEVMSTAGKNCFDLRGRLHAKMQETLIVPSVPIASLMLELLESLERAAAYVKEIVKEVQELQNHIDEPDYPLISARRSVYEMDLQDEMCYSALLCVAPSALERLLARRFWNSGDEASAEYRHCTAEKELCKWKQILQIIKYCQVTLSNA